MSVDYSGLIGRTGFMVFDLASGEIKDDAVSIGGYTYKCKALTDLNKNDEVVVVNVVGDILFVDYVITETEKKKIRLQRWGVEEHEPEWKLGTEQEINTSTGGATITKDILSYTVPSGYKADIYGYVLNVYVERIGGIFTAYIQVIYDTTVVDRVRVYSAGSYEKETSSQVAIKGGISAGTVVKIQLYLYSGDTTQKHLFGNGKLLIREYPV